MKSMKEAIKYLESLGIEKGKINGASFGNNGSYLFFANQDGDIIKTKIGVLGISYVSEDRLHKFYNEIYLPAIGKEHVTYIQNPEQDELEI